MVKQKKKQAKIPYSSSEILKTKDLDCILLFHKRTFPNPNFIYFTKIQEVFLSVLIVEKKKNTLFVSPLEKGTLKKGNFSFRDLSSEEIQKYLHERKITKIGICNKFMSVKDLEKLKKIRGMNFKDVSEDLERLRSQKRKDEISKIRKCCRITDDIFSSILKNIKKFNNEKDVVQHIKKLALEKDSEPSFDPIVASGKNSAIPHHIPRDRIREGFLLIDFGIKKDGYCSDMTRTIYLGRPNRSEIDSYNSLLKIQHECIELLKKKKHFKEVHEYAKDNLGDHFTHALGHGIGIEVHESPSLNGKSDDLIRKDMVFTIEPGVYYNGRYGIRIEDTVVMRESLKGNKNPHLLTRSKKELITIPHYKKQRSTNRK